MALCLMLVGISGSGKSTRAQRLSTEMGAAIVSSDSIRAELWGNEKEQKNPQKVFQLAHRRVREFLCEGKDVIFDATNLSARRRSAFLKEMKQISPTNCFGVEVELVPPYKCIEADKKRDRSVGEVVIRRQVSQFCVPSFYEGWNWIRFRYPSYKDALSLDSIIAQHRGTIADEHENPHHRLTISAHMTKCDEIAQKLGANDEVCVAARYHDIGKYFTKVYRRNSDIAHFFGHENVGTYLYLCSATAQETDQKEVLATAFLIQHHMDRFMRGGVENYEKFLATLGEIDRKNLVLLTWIDENSEKENLDGR